MIYTTLDMKKKTMLQDKIASPRLSLEETQEASEAHRNDDNDDREGRKNTKIADAIMRTQHRRGKEKHEPKGKTTCAAGLAALPPSSFGHLQRGREAGGGLDLGRSSIGEDTTQEKHKGQGRGGTQGKNDWELGLICIFCTGKIQGGQDRTFQF
jgi:hypothetical protein